MTNVLEHPVKVTTREDWKSDQDVRWCPGCGDYSILTAIQKTLPTTGSDPDHTVVVSGIGCAARFPYYMNTYGIHSIHGRAPAFATGIALSRPELDVWVVGGDGDLLSIGGNHLLHALRRNVNLTILMFDNQIYGLTKGQYSPTSPVGKITTSTPEGSTDHPLHPLSVALGADATFVARTTDSNPVQMQEVIARAHAHKGASFVQILQNCNIFNNGTYEPIVGKNSRAEMSFALVHGEPIRIGAERDRGVMLTPSGLETVTVTPENEAQLLVHDETREDLGIALMLARMSIDGTTPMPFGVFRSVDHPIHRTSGHFSGPGNDADLEAIFAGASTYEIS